jgi:D-alanyl-D-alanine carboxypeptidase (penicillin-binding protein 5/6)
VWAPTRSRRILDAMLEPSLDRREWRRRRRRRQIVRRRAIALLVLTCAAALLTWQLWPSDSVETVTPARASATKPATKLAKVTKRHVPTRPAPLLVATPTDARIEPARRLSAKAAILVDAGSGRVLYGRNAHQRRHVASTTKILTALLALERLDPHKIVKIDKSVPRVPLVREGLRAGERVEAWKLFYGLMLFSGNDDALALAIAAAGTRPEFVRLMNARARALGLRDSHFRSPSGVEDVDNYSSAWDLAALTRVALRNPRFRAIVRTHRKNVPWSPPTYAKTYLNHNLLIGTYPGANGVKTGYTEKSGHCLVASATRNDRTLIAVLLDDPNMYVDARRLLNAGFRSAP